MKKITVIKKLFFASLLLAGMNIYTSCDSCNRKESTQENTMETDNYGSTIEEDTMTTGDINDNATSSASISASKSSGSNTGSTTKTTSTKTSSTTKTSTTSAKDEAARQQAITDQIENSDAKSGAVDKKGNPIRSSGDSGTGSGTGTGSTGNNSRVTTREAQKGN